MSNNLHKVFAGIGSSVTVTLMKQTVPPTVLTGVFAGTESLTAQVWPGNSQAVTFTPTATWLSGPNGTISIAYSAANTASVAPGWYEGLVKLSDGSAALAQWGVHVYGTPGTSAADLVTMPYVRAALADVTLSESQAEFLPTAVSLASDAVRQWCNRWFTRRTLTREYEPTYDGRIMLAESPVNQVLRVSTDLQDAIIITCSSSTNQVARAYFTTSGDRISGLTYTGLTLTRTASGTTTTNTLSFATYATVTALAAAVNALGGGWSATVASDMGGWPTSELAGGDTAQGCLDDGATFRVYAGDASDYAIDWQTGLVTLAHWRSTASSTETARWGPGAAYLFPPAGRVRRVLVTHDLGYDTIPAAVQQAAAELSKFAVLSLANDPTLASESADKYSYTMAAMQQAITPTVRQLLSLYRNANA